MGIISSYMHILPKIKNILYRTKIPEDGMGQVPSQKSSVNSKIEQ